MDAQCPYILKFVTCQRRFRLYSMQEWIQARSPKVAEVQVQICQEPPKLLLARALGSAHSKAHSDPEFNDVGLRKNIFLSSTFPCSWLAIRSTTSCLALVSSVLESAPMTAFKLVASSSLLQTKVIVKRQVMLPLWWVVGTEYKFFESNMKSNFS